MLLKNLPRQKSIKSFLFYFWDPMLFFFSPLHESVIETQLCFDFSVNFKIIFKGELSFLIFEI